LNKKSTKEIDWPDEPWKYPYVAAVVDFGSNLQIVVRSVEEARVGYTISPQIRFHHTDPAVLGFIDEFCTNHGVNPRLREKGTTYRLEINRRDDLETLLLLVQPYVLARAEASMILLEDLIPGLNEGLQGNEEGFCKLMGYVDEVRSHTVTRQEPKYTEDYFRSDFGL
jgi:hypothetical protein